MIEKLLGFSTLKAIGTQREMIQLRPEIYPRQGASNCSWMVLDSKLHLGRFWNLSHLMFLRCARYNIELYSADTYPASLPSAGQGSFLQSGNAEQTTGDRLLSFDYKERIQLVACQNQRASSIFPSVHLLLMSL